MMLFRRNRAEVIARQASETTTKPEADLGYNTRLQIGLGKSGVLFVIRDVDTKHFAETKWNQTPGRLLRNQRNGAVCVMSDRRIPRDTFCRKQTKDIPKPAASDTATKDDMHEVIKLYDEISDSCAVWNVDVCRRETFTQRGKGTCVYMRDLRVMCDVMFDVFMCDV